ncbi:MAG: extracellular solute-binding protein [Clostridia bacterium]|nr:extracellular solute-binding protein [Clostridia bacterium]MCI8980275.1 extracellular solute-binding protein [Clostridia bacterium]MCI9086035.1 extracellular solute-binding protein [Clostridia bacterium]
MRLNKVIALSLAAAIAVPMLASCGKQKTETVDENGNKIYSYTLNMYTQDDNEYPTQEDTLFNNYIRDNFGIKFVYDRIPRTDWETKTNTYFATGDSPDVTIGGKEMNYKAWGNEGYLAPIDYTKLPNWCALWGDNLDKVVSLASNSDGNLYYLPTVRQEKVQMCWLYRKDIFDALNISFPKTADEFVEACKKIKAQYPDNIIISSNGQKKSSLTGFFQMFWIPELILQTQSCIDPVTNEFVPYAMASDNAREMYKFVNSLYKEGLIDKEILSIEKDNFYTRCAQNNAFITYNYVYNTDTFNNKTNVNGNTGANWDWAGNMVTAYPDKGTIYKKDPLYSNWGPAFSAELGADTERFDALLKYYDWCATDEGQLFTSYGVEGESYNMVDGKPEVADGWYHEKDNPEGKKINREYGTLTYTFNKYPKLFEELRGNQIEKLYDAYMANDKYYYFDEFPMRYTEDEEKRYTDLETALNSKRDEYMARFFMGESDPASDADWEAYLSDLKKVGLDEFVELQKTVYERTKAEVQ